MLSANHYEGLLESALKSMKELRSIHSSTFAFNISNYLASTHRNEASHLDRRYGEFVRLATAIIAASTRDYDECTEPYTLFEQAYTLRYQILCLLENDHLIEALEMCKAFLELDERASTLFKQYQSTYPLQESQSFLPQETADDLIQVLPRDADEAASMRARMTGGSETVVRSCQSLLRQRQRALRAAMLNSPVRS